MNIKILTLGHLPISIGGRQTSGLSEVIWSIADGINSLGNKKYIDVIASTDINVLDQNIENTRVLGWSRATIIKYMLFRPHLFLFYGYTAIKLKSTYEISLSRLAKIFIKLIYYHKTIDEQNPKILHMHGCDSILYLSLLNTSNLNIIVTIHGICGNDKLIPDYKNLKNMESSLSKSNKVHSIIFIANSLKEEWINLYSKSPINLLVILNAYNKSNFYYTKSTKKNKHLRLVTLGSISERKGQVRVLEALSAINRDDIEYVCIGDGDFNYVNKLKDYSKDNNVHVEWLGFKNPSEIRVILGNADYMILPSSSEGFGLVYIESIACGVKVILPKNLPLALESQLINKSNSILLNDSSSDSIIEVIKSLESDSANREVISNSVATLDWSSVSLKYIELFDWINND